MHLISMNEGKEKKTEKNKNFEHENEKHFEREREQFLATKDISCFTDHN